MLPLQEASLKLVDNIHLNDPLSIPCISQQEVLTLQEPTDLKVINQLVAKGMTKDHKQTHSRIVWIEACLRNPKGIRRPSEGLSYATNIQKWVAETIIPGEIFSVESSRHPGSRRAAASLSRQRFQLKALAAFRLLSSLYHLVPDLSEELDPIIIVCYASYTDPCDPWTLPGSLELATGLLNIHMKNTATSTFAMSSILLKQYVRPAFLKDRSAAITEHGRKTIDTTSMVPTSESFTVHGETWKASDPYTVTILGWSLAQLTNDTVESLWADVIPPVLTILDDETIGNKVRGCALVQSLLEKASPDLLKRTGVGEVLEDALLPCLSYLPPLTPEAESLELMAKTFSALRSLTNVRFPTSMTTYKADAYTKAMRLGVFNGIAHCGDYVNVSEFLVRQMATLIDDMGIFSVKLLKDVIPILVSNLSDPFALSHPPLLVASIETLKVVFLNDWPRIGHYSGSILKALSICWCRLEEDVTTTAEQYTGIRTHLRAATSIEVLLHYEVFYRQILVQ